ncbi:MAG: DUF1883 domain-containing protein [Fidelibacterota bacterium]|nr:MAG: DUF1883 domain-containing protein [Candidatus Neomarinimicrobiota bacterium]
MQFLHYSLDLGTRDVVQVELRTQAYVRLLDEENYEAYRAGSNYRYYGGLAEKSPANIKPPHNGKWHLCVDLGGREGELNASVHIIQEVAPDSGTKRRRRLI